MQLGSNGSIPFSRWLPCTMHGLSRLTAASASRPHRYHPPAPPMSLPPTSPTSSVSVLHSDDFIGRRRRRGGAGVPHLACLIPQFLRPWRLMPMYEILDSTDGSILLRWSFSQFSSCPSRRRQPRCCVCTEIDGEAIVDSPVKMLAGLASSKL
jgi:hypothetical protein